MEEDGDDKDDTKRMTRNLSEKKRRDQFNMLVNELSSMVSTNNRKMDKSSILRSTISCLRNHNEITSRSRAHDIQEDWKPPFLTNEEFIYLVLEAMEGFVMVFSTSGRIYYVSESIASLGYNPTDILNRNIFDITFEEDRLILFNFLQNPVISADSSNAEKLDLLCHLKRGVLDLKEETIYELVQFHGYFRTNGNLESNSGNQKDVESGNIIFICTGRLQTPQLIRDISLMNNERNEFTSRHSLEWKYLFLDHRAPPIIGYLPFEVLGTSGYDYYHFDDLEKVVTCHQTLMEKGETTTCYYRFLTKGQQWIWLQSRYYISYHQWNSKPEFVVCTSRVVSNIDVVKNSNKWEGDAVSNEFEASSANFTVATSEQNSAPVPWVTSDDNESLSTSSRLPIQSRKLNSVAQSVEQRSNITQYLEPTPYINNVGLQSILPIAVPTAPVAVLPNDEIQLQRKHEELQALIIKQQEELRHVKEQLFMARLGIVQPVIAVPNQITNPEDNGQDQSSTSQINYEESGSQRSSDQSQI